MSQSDGLQPSQPYQTNQPITEHVTRGACQLHKNLSFYLLVALIGSGLRSWDDNKNPVNPAFDLVYCSLSVLRFVFDLDISKQSP